jgi:ubiquinone/menaquinone biosynthesis C-methylase UbiE
MATEEREQTRVAWDAIATGYDEFVTPSHIDLGADALYRAGLRASMRFLDVAAGSGALSIPAARLGAQVLSVLSDHGRAASGACPQGGTQPREPHHGRPRPRPRE